MLRELGRPPLHARCPTRTSPGSRSSSTTGRATSRPHVPELPVVGDVLPRAGGGRRTSRELVDAGVEVFKVHVQVGRLRPRRPAARRGLGACSRSRDAGRHARGLGPGAHRVHRPRPGRARLLRRHPRLPLVIAHLGAPEYVEFLALAERFERVHLDTTMAFTDFFEQMAPYPRDAAAAARATCGRQGAAGQRLPEHPVPVRRTSSSRSSGWAWANDWLRAVCWDNGARLFGMNARGTPR